MTSRKAFSWWVLASSSSSATNSAGARQPHQLVDLRGAPPPMMLRQTGAAPTAVTLVVVLGIPWPKAAEMEIPGTAGGLLQAGGIRIPFLIPPAAGEDAELHPRGG